jgi:NADP-dependent aldehyde dehydrogenase
VFSMLQGDGRTIGVELVAHPAIKAVAFTGSRQGGLALMRVAAQRDEPIPVYAEMSSVNPVFVLPGAMDIHAESIAQGFVESMSLGSGQLCTNPGLVIAIDNFSLNAFRKIVVGEIEGQVAGTMLTPGIHAAYHEGVKKRARQSGVQLLARSSCGPSVCDGQAAFFEVDAATFLANGELEEEIFGASSLLIRCRDMKEMSAVAEQISGQLTATLFIEDCDHSGARCLLPTLERKAGRVIFNGYPTGVEVSHAMVHGGPFPATSDSRTTSVGAMAIDRFLRPVSYQNMPVGLLPPSLQDANPMSLWRGKDGQLGRQ